jgi:hypothetical protein
MLHISKWERHSNASRDALGTAALNLCKNAKSKMVFIVLSSIGLIQI